MNQELGMKILELKKRNIIQSQKLSSFSNLIHGSSPPYCSPDTFLKILGPRLKNIVTGEQIHGDKIKVVTSKNPKTIPKTDGLITNRKNIFLAIFTADCVPVFLYDFKKEVVGLIHAGWKGT